MTLAQAQRRWFTTYLATWIVGAVFASTFLDYGWFLLSYLTLSIPFMFLSFILSKCRRIVGIYVLTILLNALTLGLSAMAVPHVAEYVEQTASL
ncbi:MAG: hypothetical protein JXQ73_17685 [Phycisphaerae bacterium]|nr:hypothetical protein [Phycisphaerae bacterium]